MGSDLQTETSMACVMCKHGTEVNPGDCRSTRCGRGGTGAPRKLRTSRRRPVTFRSRRIGIDLSGRAALHVEEGRAPNRKEAELPVGLATVVAALGRERDRAAVDGRAYHGVLSVTLFSGIFKSRSWVQELCDLVEEGIREATRSMPHWDFARASDAARSRRR
jgi:hypothetical protein